MHCIRVHRCRTQVSTLKNNWGLIKAVERPLEVFFHFSSLADGLEGSLKVRTAWIALFLELCAGPKPKR